jgi:hypothetical protein
MANQEKPYFLSDILKKSMRQSFLKAAKLAKQTDTELVIYNGQMIETLKGKAIDTYIKNLPPQESV